MRFFVYILLTCAMLCNYVAGADPVDINDRLHLADGLFRRSLFDLAAREYQSLAANPDTPGRDTVLFRLAECQRRLGKNSEAAEVYKQLIDVAPDSAQVPRARLQRALLLMDMGGASLTEALAEFEPLTAETNSVDVRTAALYHKGEVLEKLQRFAEAKSCYDLLRKDFAESEYGSYASLKAAWLLSRSESKEDKRKSLGIYLELTYGAKDMKVAEEANYFAAQGLLADEKYEESTKLFKMLHEKFPESPRVKESTLAAAWACFYSGKYQEGIDYLASVKNDAAYPQRSEALYVLANCYRELNRNDEAIAAYQEQLRLEPQGRLAPKAHYELLTTLYRTGKNAEVLDSINKVANTDDTLVDNILWMQAEAALKIEKFDIVIQACRTLVEKCPQSPFVINALYRLGWVLQKQGVWEEASTWFLKVANTFPEDPLAATSLYASGVCLVRINQSEGALRDWTALLSKYPDSSLVAETLYQKAMEEIRIKQSRAAGATLDELLRRFPDNNHKAEILYWRGTIYRELNDLVEAEKAFRSALAAKPAKEFERECMLELGLLLHNTGRSGEAAELFNKLLDSNIADKLGEDKLAWLAEFQQKNKQYDSASKAAYVLIKLQPDKGWQQTAWTIIGRVHNEKGESDPAIYAFQQALATGASTDYGAEAALKLGELLTRSGRYDEAEKTLNEAAGRAANPELIGMRARAYAGLARNAELKGDLEAAIRYYISVGILFDHKEIVPQALHKSAELLDKQGRSDEALKISEELKQRYPDSPLAR